MKISFFFAQLLVVLALSFGCKQQQPMVATTPPDWSTNATIYELNIRQFSPEGTFEAVEKRLDELKSLGVDIIWLMPIHPIGELNRKGSMGSYYAVKDYLDVNPEFGSKSDFRSLVQSIHKKGMKVIIDWVANHTAWDNPLTLTNKSFYTLNAEGNFVPPVDDWEDVIDLAYEITDSEGNTVPNRPLWDYKVDALRYWVKEFDIDGYRCDVADMVPHEFWVEARAALDEIKPVFMLAEAETPLLHVGAFDASYSWRMHHLFNHIAQGKESARKIKDYIREDRKRFPKGAMRMVFTDNHDENSWNGTVFERMGDATEAFAVLSFVIEGTPLIYTGQEAGLDKRLAFFEKDVVEWNDHPFRTLYTKLNMLKKSNPALADANLGGEMKFIKVNRTNRFFAFTRSVPGNKVLALFNLSAEPGLMQYQSDHQKGQYVDFFSGATVTVEPSGVVELPAWGYRILVSK